MSENLSELAALTGMGPRVDFKADIFDTAIRQKGYKLIWEQAMLCSCYTPSSGQPAYGCPACRGKGYIYFNPVETRAIVTSISGRKEQDHIGLNELGTAYLTALSTDDVGFRDRFTFLDFTMKYSQLVEKGAPDKPDMLAYPAADIIAVRRLNEIYRRGIDFDLSKDGWYLEWKGGNLIQGDVYSVLLKTAAVYIAINPIHELRGTYTTFKQRGGEQFVPLPKQFQIKREDFLGGENRPSYNQPLGPDS